EIVEASASPEFCRAVRPYWPVAGADAAIVVRAWVMREIALGAAKLPQAIFHRPEQASDGPCVWAEFDLPASKCDQEANGKRRALDCACPSPLRPVAAFSRAARAASQAAATQGAPAQGAPLFPVRKGGLDSKGDFIRFFQDASAMVAVDVAAISGRSPRVAGARRMALAGVHVWVIQLFGQWGSDVALWYCREVLAGGRAAPSTWAALAQGAGSGGDVGAELATQGTRPRCADFGGGAPLEHVADELLESMVLETAREQ
ncbi:unnamed protein product, partial [Prorocentrum cordatum]